MGNVSLLETASPVTPNGWTDLKIIILLETNTQPGMTPTSLTPEQAKFCGISFEGLCKSLIEDASCNR